MLRTTTVRLSASPLDDPPEPDPLPEPDAAVMVAAALVEVVTGVGDVVRVARVYELWKASRRLELLGATTA